jgi:hypothetical protein
MSTEAKLRSYNIANLTYVDIQNYLKEKDAVRQYRTARTPPSAQDGHGDGRRDLAEDRRADRSPIHALHMDRVFTPTHERSG